MSSDTTFADEIQPASGATFDFNGITISNVAPVADQILTATSGTAAEWQTGVSALQTSGAPVVVNGSSPPVTGDIFFASSATVGEWGAFAADNLSRVRVATTEAGTLSSEFENGDTVDGVVLVTGDRILIKDQSTGTENGIYIVQASGAPVRSDDFSGGASVSAKFFWVAEGTLSANNGFVVTNVPGSDVVGTDVIDFRIFSNSETVLTVASSSALSVAVSNGVGDIVMLPGVYALGSTLVLSSDTTIKGSGRSTVLQAVDPLAAPIIDINNVSRVCIKGLQIDGNESNVTTPDNLVEIGGASTSDIVIEDCNFIGSGTSVRNIEVTGVTKLVIKDCIFDDSGNLGDHIWVDASSNTVDAISIKNCRFADLAASKFNIAVFGANYEQGRIDGCIFGSTAGRAISVSDGRTIISNCILNAVTGLASISASGDDLIKNCHLDGCSRVTDGTSAANLSVVGNVINNGTENAVQITGNQSIIAGNVIENATLFGISMQSTAENGVVQSNLLRLNSSGNIEVDTGSGNNKYTRVIENNCIERITTSTGFTVSGYDDVVDMDPSGTGTKTATLADNNFGSAGHVIYIEFSRGVTAEEVQLTPTTAGVDPSGAAYTRVDFISDGDYAIFQWTITGTGWNILDVSGASIVP